MQRLRDQTDAQSSADSTDGFKSRTTVRVQRLIKHFACDACRLGNLSHPASASNIAQRSCKQSGIVGFENVGQIGSDQFLAVKVWGKSQAPASLLFLPVCPSSTLLQSGSAASALARLMSLFQVRFDPPASNTMIDASGCLKYIRQPAPTQPAPTLIRNSGTPAPTGLTSSARPCSSRLIRATITPRTVAVGKVVEPRGELWERSG
jgi:hypothetical protein